MSMFPQMADFIRGMREELTSVGFKELKTPDEVDAELAGDQGTTLLFVNSVCGCAAGQARPAARAAIQHKVRPDKLLTVFAGQEKEATARAREYITGYPPSSPSIALFKDGKLVAMIERRNIESRHGAAIRDDLVAMFDQFCS